MRCGVCSSNASTVAGFATSTTWNRVSSRSGVASTRTSLTEQFDSGVFDYAHMSGKRRPLWAQTVTDVFVYELLMRLLHIGNFCFWVPFLKQLLLRNCAVNFVEICSVYVAKMIITAAERIFNSDKICRSYSDLNFGVTFFGTQCMWQLVLHVLCPILQCRPILLLAHLMSTLHLLLLASIQLFCSLHLLRSLSSWILPSSFRVVFPAQPFRSNYQPPCLEMFSVPFLMLYFVA